MKYATIIEMKRINGSVNGNPNYSFMLLEADNPHDAQSGQNDAISVDRRTKSDISDSYGTIPNECKPGVVIAYEQTRAGRVYNIKTAKSKGIK